MSEKTIYKFVGNGDGVPGLPHEVSQAEAAQLGAASLLQDAIASGTYIEKSSSASPRRGAGKAQPSAVSAETDKE